MRRSFGGGGVAGADVFGFGVNEVQATRPTSALAEHVAGSSVEMIKCQTGDEEHNKGPRAAKHSQLGFI